MKLATIVAVAALAASCGGSPSSQANNVSSKTPTPGASASPSPSASVVPSTSPSPPPVTGAFGVLYGSQAAASYSVSIVGVDGKVVASAQVSTPALPSCANAAAAVVSPPLSTSNSSVYFEDAQGAIHYLRPTGETGTATTVPAPSASRRSMFTVSPDDSRIAVIVDDFNSSGASTRLYAENLSGGGNHVDLFSETGAYSLWPIGWHGTNNLVLAKAAACTQGGGPFCCGPLELHVVDPATANRRFTLGNSSSCVIAGTPSPAGVVCENTPSFTQGTWLNWTAGTVRSLALNGAAFAYVSPGGQFVAFVDNNGTSFTIGAPTIAGMFACEWIDDNHVLSGGDAQHQPRVATATTSAMAPVAAQGDCGGRLPGGL
ncbi:MAG TPA: hypothetical protein VJS19_13255 [Candidatus Dormibacteraeota bacterium]|nr:hypothetical protein [Candidatus Dormibacteraeota bacterium]